MISTDVLRGVRTIVSHERADGPCADGVAAALICKDALPHANVIFVNYNTAAHRSIPAEPGLLFVDMTPPRERVEEFVRAGAIVLDHHEGARALVERFGPLGVYSDEPGVSGAVLAYREVWLPLCDSPREYVAKCWDRFATIAGIRDTWQRNDERWEEACAQAAALRFFPWSALVAENVFRLEEKLDEMGPILLAKDADRDARTIAEAHRFTSGGLHVVCFEGTHTSDIAEALGDETDLVMGWHYRVEAGRQQMVVSCRSRGSFSALKFAEAHGGGGHQRAAGFTVGLGRGLDPYQHLEMLVREYCDRGDGCES